MRQSTPNRLWSVVVYGVATPLVAVPALGVLGTFLHDVPYVGLATAYVPWYLPWLTVAVLIGGALALSRWRRGLFAKGLTVLAVLAVIGASVINARMTAAVEHAGADVDLVDVFGVGLPDAATPDAEATYTTFEGEPLQLSIYRPSDSTPASRAPVLVYIHGGGWVAGDRHSRSADLRWFAERGWLTISVGYALSSPDRHLADVTQDQIGCAMAWIGRHSPAYGGDPSKLAVSGHSAGGNLAINTGYMAANGTLRSSCGGQIPAVGAVSAMYPVVDPTGFYANDDPVLGGRAKGMVGGYTGGSPEQFPQRYARISSGAHISRAAPPTLIILPAADHLVPTAGAYRFVEQARSAGVDVKLVTVPYADHVFDAQPGSIGQQAYRQLTAQWLGAHGRAPTTR